MILRKSLKMMLCLLGLTALNALAAGEVYKVASDPYLEPYSFKDENGNVIGFNRDLIETIGEDQGFTVQVIEGKWPGSIDDLGLDPKKKKNRDVIMSLIVKGNPVTKRLLESDPYLYVPKSVIGYVDDSLEINGVESLRSLRVGVSEKSIDEPYLRENGVTNLMGGEVDTPPRLFELLRRTVQKKYDAFIGDRVALEHMANKFASRVNLKIKPLYPDQGDDFQPLVALFHPEDVELANKFNTGLKNIKNSGKYQEIVTKWFGENAPVK